ncbi:BMP family lipoprotein [Arthrobacter sp. SD76]|uniref:BMP family lipoprotein n=1 Tax=Arthrobacter sp. SD76 TaxID=3415007 RepID=UPI003C7626C7
MRRSSRFIPSAVTAGCAALALTLAGCSGAAPAAESDPEGDQLKIGLYVAGAFGDRSYYDAAAEAIPKLEEEFKAVVATYEAKQDAQAYAPLMQDAAAANELLFVVGDQVTDIAVEVASQNPDTKVVLVNTLVPREGVASVGFDWASICYPAGVLAALANRESGANSVGFVMGFKTPAMTTCESSFHAAAVATNPALKLVSQAAGTFSDPNKGYEVATALSQQGAHSTLTLAGLTTQGVVKAAQEGQPIAPITINFGQPADVSLAGAITRVDVLMLDAAKKHADGSLQLGGVDEFAYQEGATEWILNDALVNEESEAAVKDVIEKIKSGTLDPKA